MMSWLLPQNKSANVTLPVGPSKTYSFSILTHGNLRRSRFNLSRSFENLFSFARSFLRATSHCFCETTLRFSILRAVLIFGINFSVFFLVSQQQFRRDYRPKTGANQVGEFNHTAARGRNRRAITICRHARWPRANTLKLLADFVARFHLLIKCKDFARINCISH